MLSLLVLAGMSLLAGIVLKVAGMTHGIMGTVPSSYLEMTKIFLLGAIAVGCTGATAARRINGTRTSANAQSND